MIYMKSINYYLANVDVVGSAKKIDIETLEKAFNVSFPEDYKQFLETNNGIEGGIGENSYVQIWETDDIIIRNKRLDVDQFAPGLILFGSDGGDTAYAFNTRDRAMPIVEVPFIGMSLNAIKFCAKDLLDFFEYLYIQ